MKTRHIAIALLTFLAVLSCNKEPDFVSVEESRLTLDARSQTVTQHILSRGEWHIDLNGAVWLRVTPGSGVGDGIHYQTFEIIVDENPGGSREQTVYVCQGSVRCPVTVHQNRGEVAVEEPVVSPSAFFKVVSHRGGYLESGAPENSIQGLSYSERTGCYAAECDIVSTRDGKALVCHPVDSKVNGFIPYEKNVGEIRAAGKLKNGEDIPVMEDFLDFLCDPAKNPEGMKIWIDTKAWKNLSYTIDAINAAYAAIKERNACDLCEFIIPQNETLFGLVRETDLFKEKKCNVGFMASEPAGLLDPGSFGAMMWHQVKFSAIFPDTAPYAPADYLTAGVPLSIWCCGTPDSENTSLIQKAFPYYRNKYFKALFVNYPQAAITKLKAAGISSD